MYRNAIKPIAARLAFTDVAICLRPLQLSAGCRWSASLTPGNFPKVPASIGHDPIRDRDRNGWAGTDASHAPKPNPPPERSAHHAPAHPRRKRQDPH